MDGLLKYCIPDSSDVHPDEIKDLIMDEKMDIPFEFINFLPTSSFQKIRGGEAEKSPSAPHTSKKHRQESSSND